MEDRYYEEKFNNIKETLNKHDKLLTDQDKQINEIKISYSNAITKISIVLERLTELTESNFETNKATEAAVNCLTSKVDLLDTNFGEMKTKFEESEKENNLSIRGFIKKHFVEVLVGVLVLAALGTWAVSKFAGILP